MLSVINKGQHNGLACLRLKLWPGFLFIGLALVFQVYGYADSAATGNSDTEMPGHWAARFEVTNKNVLVDEFGELPEALLTDAAQYAEYLGLNQAGLLLYWSFPQEINPELVSCLKSTRPAGVVQMPMSQSVGPVPEFRLLTHNNTQAIKLGLGASQGVLLLALDGFQFDIFCPQARYSQPSGSPGQMIAVHFVKPSAGQALAVPEKQSARITTSAKNSTETHSYQNDGFAGLPAMGENRNSQPGTMHLYGSDGYFDSPGKPGKGGRLQQQPVQIVIMLPAISLGTAGLIDIPVDFASSSQPDNADPDNANIVTRLYEPPTGQQGYSVVIVQVTDGSGTMHRVSIPQQYWVRIVDQGLHRNATFLYNLAVHWPRHNQQRDELEKTLGQLMADYDREVSALLVGNATAEDSDYLFQRAQVTVYDIERLWQSLTGLIPRRLWVILEQHAQSMVLERWQSLSDALTTAINTEKTETVTVKGILSRNGTETGATSTTQTPSTNSWAGGGHHGGVSTFPSSHSGALPGTGGGTGGGAGGWTPPDPEEPPPPYSPPAIPVDFEKYITDDFSKSLWLGGKDFNFEARRMSLHHIHASHHGIFLWMLGGRPLANSPEEAKTTDLPTHHGRFRRGYLYVIADVLGLNNVKRLLDPLKILGNIDRLDLLWQTTFIPGTHLNKEDALDVIGKLNMAIIARQYTAEHYQYLKSYVTNNLGQLSAAEKQDRIYQQASMSDGGQEFVILKLAEKIFQSRANDPIISDPQHRSYMAWHNFLTRYLPRETTMPEPMPALLNHLPRENSASTVLVPAPVVHVTRPPECPSGQGSPGSHLRQPVCLPPHLSFSNVHLPATTGLVSTFNADPLSSFQMPTRDDSLPTYSMANRLSGMGQSGLTVTPGISGPGSSPMFSTQPARNTKRALELSDEFTPQTKKGRHDALTLQGVYVTLKGLADAQEHHYDLSASLLGIADTELRELAFLLGVPLLERGQVGVDSETLAANIRRMELSLILNAVKVMLDGAVNHQAADGQSWARQAIALTGRQLSSTQVIANLLPMLRRHHAEVDYFQHCPMPFLCLAEWWGRAFNNGNIHVRVITEWLQDASLPHARQWLDYFISCRQQNIEAFRQSLPNHEMALISTLASRGSDTMMRPLTELAHMGLHLFGSTPGVYVEQLLLNEMAIGGLSWAAIQTQFQNSGLNEFAMTIQHCLDPLQNALAAPIEQPPESTIDLPPPSPFLLLQLRLRGTDALYDPGIGRYVQTESGSWFIQVDGSGQRDFLSRQLGSLLEQHPGLYVALPPSVAFIDSITEGMPLSELAHQVQRLNDWLQFLFSRVGSAPDLSAVESLRRVGNQSQYLFAMQGSSMFGGAYIGVQQLQQLARLIIDMVLKATGATLESPRGMSFAAPATLYKQLKKHKLITSEHHSFIDMALKLNGSIHGMSPQQVEAIMTGKSAPGDTLIESESLDTETSSPIESDVSDIDSTGGYQSVSEGYPDDYIEKDSAGKKRKIKRKRSGEK